MINAIMRKSIIAARELPTPNCIRLNTHTALRQAPPGRKNVILGIKIPLPMNSQAFPAETPDNDCNSKPDYAILFQESHKLFNESLGPCSGGGEGAGAVFSWIFLKTSSISC